MEQALVNYEDFTRIAPQARDALLALGNATASAGFDKPLTELVKLRVSQINGCAFCLQIHLTIARRLGVPAAKLDLVATWRDAGIFSAREQAALAWAELLTRFADGAVPHDAWAALREEFSETEAVWLSVAIATINAWNRLGVGLRFAPSIPAP
jgi:AhpD family alkylhydroperoxidase